MNRRPMNRCLNPSCKKDFTPGRYGKLQRICGLERCKKWYRSFFAATGGPPRGISDGDLAVIEERMKDWPLVFRVLVVLARETGMRRGEIIGLTWGDVMNGSEVRKVVRLRGQWSDKKGVGFKESKTGEGRQVLVTEKARRIVQELRKESPGRVLGNRMIAMSGAWAWRAWTGFQKYYGIKSPETKRPYRLHDLRHTAAIELVKKGRIDLAQKLLGHRSIATTLKYAERPGEELLEDIEKTRRGK